MPKGRIARRLAIAAAGLVGLVVVLLLAAIFVVQGKTLASIVHRVLPPMRGKIEVQAVRWKARALVDLLTDRPTPVVVEGLKVIDPEGVVVLEAPRLAVKVRARSAIGGKIFLHDLEIGPGSLWRFAALKKSEGNGFLSAFQPAGAVAPVTPPPRAPGEPADPFVFQIVNAQVDGLTAVFDFPAWGLALRNLKGPVWLTVDGNFVGWDGTGLDARDGGHLRIMQEVLPFDRVLVNRVATTREWPDSIFLDVGAARTGRSVLTAKGYFTEIYGYGYEREPDAGIDLHGEISNAADALTAVARAHAIPGLRLGGDQAKVVLDLKQPFARLAIAARISGLDVAFGEYQAQQLALRARVVTDPLTLTLDELTFGAPGGGRLILGADLAGTAVKARLRFDRFTTTSYLPRALHKLAAGKLIGRIGISGDFGEDKRLSLNPVEIKLARSRAAAKLPSSLQVRGHASASANRIFTEGISIGVPGASASVRGEINLARKLFRLGLRASTTDLPQLLSAVGMQPLARGAALSVEADGSFKAPRANGELVVHGIKLPGGMPGVDQVTSRFHLDDGTLHLDSLSAQAFGGEIEARGQVALFQKTIDRMLRSPLVKFELQGRDVELALLLSLGWATGKVSFVASAEGPLDKLHARVQLPAGARINVQGSIWELRGIEVEATAREVVVRTARLVQASGAQIELEGRMAFGGPMTWRVAIRDVAIEGLPGVASAGVPLSGRISADLQASGTLARPILAGRIAFGGVKARGTRLGDGELLISQLGDSGVLVKGNLFRRLDVEAAVTYGAAGTRVRGAVAFNKLQLEDFLPELADLGDGKGLATGRITVDLRPDAPLSVEARLEDLQVSITREALDKDGKPFAQRIWLRNAGVLGVSVAGERIVLEPARLVTDGGEFRLQGELTGQVVQGQLKGHLSLDLLQPFVRRQLSGLGGDLAVDLAVGGTLTRPDLNGRVAIARPVRIQPVGTAPEVLIPSGVIRLTGNSIQLADLAVTIDESTLTLRGAARYDERFQPTSFEVNAAGEVSASLLETLAATAVSDASGKARIKATLSGTPQKPLVAARIDLGEIELRLRSLGRQITLESGTVELSNKELVLRDVKTRIDDQGRLLIGAAGVRPGRIAIDSLAPTLKIGRIDLPLKGERLTYRVPNSVEIDDLGFTLALTGDLEEGLGLAGEVLIMSGRYVQDFQVQDLVISPRIAESSARPFYEGNPLLSELGLNLRVRTVGDSFLVQNNLAPEIHVTIDLRVSGTLSEPRLAGNVRPTDGRFHIIGMRGDFELSPNVNYVTFVETKSIADGETPELNLEAVNQVTDSSGAPHLVTMRIQGPIGQAAITLSVDGNADRNQALLLLVSGRTAQDTSRFATTASPTIGSNVRTGTDVVGQITRDTVGNLVEPYIDDTLQLLTGRRINLRPTVGVDGFELKLIARANRNTDLKLSFLRGFQNQQRYRGEGSVWLWDYVSLRGYWERLTLSPQQGISEDRNAFNLELGLDFPVRWTWSP